MENIVFDAEQARIASINSFIAECAPHIFKEIKEASERKAEDFDNCFPVFRVVLRVSKKFISNKEHIQLWLENMGYVVSFNMGEENDYMIVEW